MKNRILLTLSGLYIIEKYDFLFFYEILRNFNIKNRLLGMNIVYLYTNY
ncbi:hypothetical protein [Chryseobacterium sp. 22458]